MVAIVLAQKNAIVHENGVDQNAGNELVWLYCWSEHRRKNFYSPISEDNGCYFGKDRVNLVDGGQRYIESLKVGDRVWSLSADGNSFIEDEIVLMMHNEPYRAGLQISPISECHPAFSSY